VLIGSMMKMKRLRKKHQKLKQCQRQNRNDEWPKV